MTPTLTQRERTTRLRMIRVAISVAALTVLAVCLAPLSFYQGRWDSNGSFFNLLLLATIVPSYIIYIFVVRTKWISIVGGAILFLAAAVPSVWLLVEVINGRASVGHGLLLLTVPAIMAVLALLVMVVDLLAIAIGLTGQGTTTRARKQTVPVGDRQPHAPTSG